MLNLGNPKILSKQITLTLVETQQSPDIVKIDSKDEHSFLKCTIFTMVGEKYASTCKLIEKSEPCHIPLSKQHVSQGY